MSNDNRAVIDISNRHRNHTVRLVHDLSRAGWTPTVIPSGAGLLANRQLIELRAPGHSIRIRVSVYKVGNRGEPHRLDERRIEITTTFTSGLQRVRGSSDVVLGYDFENDAYVGLDPRRLSLGGDTHNASSSVDPSALRAVSRSHILIRPHETPSLGLEYQAIFAPERLTEYLFNVDSIHNGAYLGNGAFSRPIRMRKAATLEVSSDSARGRQLILTHSHRATGRELPVTTRQIHAYEIEDEDSLADLSPEELEAVRNKCREVGDRGEHFVYRQERLRLHRAGRADLADRIDWVSRRSVGKGFDIRSYESDGSPKYIEVKSTVGNEKTFFMSVNEWNVAGNKGAAYWIYRVVNALSEPSISHRIPDPLAADQARMIVRAPSGWRVTIL